MDKFVALAAAALLAAGTPVFAYQETAAISFDWATNGSEISWSSAGLPNSLSTISNSTYFSQQSGSNQTTYYNPDFADTAFFASTFCPIEYHTQYGCRIDFSPQGTFPVGGTGPGASASGLLNVTDTSLTGTLTVTSTTDVGQGPQRDFATGELSTRAATGYNVRSADGSPFKNVWYGFDTTATLEVDLTGTFNATTWNIDGGTVRISDSGFQCAFADFSGVLCLTTSATPGLTSPDGAHMSWGIDLDGGGTGSGISEIDVRNFPGGPVIETLSGVLASLSVDSEGNITTNAGEARRFMGSSGGGCLDFIGYSGSAVTCGTLTASLLNITGTIIPVPAAVWLFGSSLCLLWRMRTRKGGSSANQS